MSRRISRQASLLANYVAIAGECGSEISGLGKTLGLLLMVCRILARPTRSSASRRMLPEVRISRQGVDLSIAKLAAPTIAAGGRYAIRQALGYSEQWAGFGGKPIAVPHFPVANRRL
jgi:hypothetical protein